MVSQPYLCHGPQPLTEDSVDTSADVLWSGSSARGGTNEKDVEDRLLRQGGRLQRTCGHRHTFSLSTLGQKTKITSGMLSLKLPRLLSINQVPKVFHEHSIIFGYRQPRCTATDCLFSLFQLTNETVNIWTHFLPTWYFVWNLLALSYTLDFWNEAYTWPLLVYMVSACIYPFTSSCAHTFSSMSTRARHICFFFDYGALSLYSLAQGGRAAVMWESHCLQAPLQIALPSLSLVNLWTQNIKQNHTGADPLAYNIRANHDTKLNRVSSASSATVYAAYIMPDKWINSTLHKWFVPAAVFNTVVCTALSCYSRYPEQEHPNVSKVLRLVAFAYPYFFDNIPLFYRLFLCKGEGCTHNETIPIHYKHMALAFLTGFLFATHLPERLAPGRFDYIGHSHQLFHICAIIGTHFQMKAIIMDMTLRQAWLKFHTPLPSFMDTIGAVSLALLVNILIIALFSLGLYWKPKTLEVKDQHYTEKLKND
ncbi:membrane progestin receptor delta-like isoform X2 [Hypanus sabinus]|uniref:membrane progestin receptor delta-like isoform X2 n=1 Tax=Hypanus sabinus TaxID=79690 RepID=UPI0028C4D5E5|nr:membrane progestin receptor delta-like isoform X2 [Hypanus sabinus]